MTTTEQPTRKAAWYSRSTHDVAAEPAVDRVHGPDAGEVVFDALVRRHQHTPYPPDGVRSPSPTPNG